MKQKNLKPPSLLKPAFNDDQLELKLQDLKKDMEKQKLSMNNSGSRWKEDIFNSKKIVDQVQIPSLLQANYSSQRTKSEIEEKDISVRKRQLDQQFKQLNKVTQIKKTTNKEQPQKFISKQSAPLSLNAIIPYNKQYKLFFNFSNNSSIFQNIQKQISKQKNLSNIQEVFSFLEQVNCEKYFDIFKEFGFDDLETIKGFFNYLEIDSYLLQQMMIPSTDQKPILDKIQSLNTQMNISFNSFDSKQEANKKFYKEVIQIKEKENFKNSEIKIEDQQEQLNNNLGDGEFDEEAQRKAFQDALIEFRGRPMEETKEKSQVIDKSIISHQSSIKQKKSVTFKIIEPKLDIDYSIKQTQHKLEKQKQEHINLNIPFSLYKIGTWCNNFDTAIEEVSHQECQISNVEGVKYCFNCLKVIHLGYEYEGYEFCSEDCHDFFLEKNQVIICTKISCIVCLRYFIKMKGKLYKENWLCSNRCQKNFEQKDKEISNYKESQNTMNLMQDEQANIEIDDYEDIDMNFNSHIDNLLLKYKDLSLESM